MSPSLGKRPATYDKRDIRYTDVRPKSLVLPNVPTTWGYGTDFGNYGWLMLGNGPDDTVYSGFQGCGDCVWAAAAHAAMQSAHEAKRPIPVFSGKTVVDQYSAYSGYDPVSGANDNGSDMREVLNWRQEKGLLDDTGKAHKIGAYVSVEPGNWQMLREACYLFETVEIGFKFPQSAMDQFNSGQDWTYVPNSPIDGGHAITINGHPWPGYWTGETWAQRQVMTWTFLLNLCDEIWAYIYLERYNAVTGETAQGYKDVDLEKYLTLV